VAALGRVVIVPPVPNEPLNIIGLGILSIAVSTYAVVAILVELSFWFCVVAVTLFGIVPVNILAGIEDISTALFASGVNAVPFTFISWIAVPAFSKEVYASEVRSVLGIPPEGLL
jgi:hypothetical protein